MTPAGRRLVPRRSRAERRVSFALKVLALVVLSAIALAAILEFLGRIRSVTIILVGALFFTYLIYPAVRRLSRRLPVLVAILLVYFVIAVVVAFGLAVVVPALTNDTRELVSSIPAAAAQVQQYVSDPNNPLVRNLPQGARDYLAGELPQLLKLGQSYAAAQASGALGFVLSTFVLLATVVVIPIVSVYLMMETPDILGGFMRAVPPRARPKTEQVLRDLNGVLGGFIRGQVLVGAVIGAAITLALLATHVRYAVLIGVIAGIFDIIPYVGAIVAFIPSTLLALVHDGWQHALIVALLMIGIFQAEGHLIQPKIISDSVGLSPLAVIVAILIGGDLLGIAGMFLAVPLAAMLRVLVRDLVPAYPAEPASPVLESAARNARTPAPPAKKPQRARL